MATNYPGPYEVRVFYSVDATPGGVKEHVLKLSCNIDGSPAAGTAFTAINIVRRAGLMDTLDSAVDGLVSVLRPFYNSGDASFDRAELWRYAPESFDATYVSTYDISLAGSAAAATVPASAAILTMRTTEGGTMRLTLIDTIVDDQLPFQRADFGGAGKEEDLAAFMVDDPNVWFIGRDTSYPITMLRLFYGQNEATFKSRYRG